jgi:hypothetical protein
MSAIDETIPGLKSAMPALSGMHQSSAVQRQEMDMNDAGKVENLNSLPVDHSGSGSSKRANEAGMEKSKPAVTSHA